MARRALVTGIEGFTGRYVAAELRVRGFEVHGTTRDATADATWHHVDLLDAARLAAVVATVAPSHVVHLAGIAFAATADIEAIYRVNIVGTRNLLTSLSAIGGIDRIVLASSASIYGNAANSPINEATPLAPTNDYGVSKLAMEYLATTWGDRLPLTIARPFNYTGVGQGGLFLIPKIVAAFRRRAQVIELGNLDVAREFGDVRDIARDYAGLLGAGTGGTFNLCSGTAHGLREVLVMCSAITGHTPEIRVNPAFVRSGEIARLTGDPARIRAVVASSPRHDLVATLQWMLGN